MVHIISSSLKTIQATIDKACEQANPPRNPSELTLVAVSKRQPAEAVSEAYACGLRDFGENYLQEAQTKATQLDCAADCNWHLIGSLQSNKTTEAANLFAWIHTLDRLKIAQRLGTARENAGLPAMQACVQVNLGNEQSKSGLQANEVVPFIKSAQDIAGIQLRGLMCIPEQGLDHDNRLARFGELAALLRDCQATMPGLDTLSMGMSADFTEAIQCGATMLRLGTVLFGPRQ